LPRTADAPLPAATEALTANVTLSLGLGPDDPVAVVTASGEAANFFRLRSFA
jgi:hypothetical protein